MIDLDVRSGLARGWRPTLDRHPGSGRGRPPSTRRPGRASGRTAAADGPQSAAVSSATYASTAAGAPAASHPGTSGWYEQASVKPRWDARGRSVRYHGPAIPCFDLVAAGCLARHPVHDQHRHPHRGQLLRGHDPPRRVHGDHRVHPGDRRPPRPRAPAPPREWPASTIRSGSTDPANGTRVGGRAASADAAIDAVDDPAQIVVAASHGRGQVERLAGGRADGGVDDGVTRVIDRGDDVAVAGQDLREVRGDESEPAAAVRVDDEGERAGRRRNVGLGHEAVDPHARRPARTGLFVPGVPSLGYHTSTISSGPAASAGTTIVVCPTANGPGEASGRGRTALRSSAAWTPWVPGRSRRSPAGVASGAGSTTDVGVGAHSDPLEELQAATSTVVASTVQRRATAGSKPWGPWRGNVRRRAGASGRGRRCGAWAW